MIVKVDLENRTVTNTSDTDLVLTELIVKQTTLTPGQTVTLDPETKALEI